MRKPYEDPHQHFERYIGRAADRYADGLQRAGLQPNEKLTRAMAERAFYAAREDYERQSAQTYENNIVRILHEHRARDKQIRREGARLAWITAPLVMLVFGVCAWFNWHAGEWEMALVYMAGVLAFLLMLVLAHRGGRK